MEKASNIPSLLPMFPWLMFLTPEDDKYPNDLKERETEEKKEDEVDAKVSGRITFYSISRDGYYCITGGIGVTIKHGECLSSPQGLLLIHDPYSLNCCLLNPTTMHKFDLPSLYLECSLDECYDQLLLSSSPLEQGCIIMLHDKLNHCFVYYQLGSLSSSSTWEAQDYLNHLGTEQKIVFIAALDNKRFYGCTLQGKFVVVICFTPYFQIDLIEIGFNKILPAWCQQEWLVRTCNKLFLIIRFETMWSEKMLDVRVFSLDKANDKWIRVKSIGDHLVFILGTRIAGSCLAKEAGLKGDCIHFLEDDGISMNVFDIQKGTLRCKRLCARYSMSTLLILPPI